MSRISIKKVNQTFVLHRFEHRQNNSPTFIFGDYVIDKVENKIT